jgi:hypothetical protein
MRARAWCAVIICTGLVGCGMPKDSEPRRVDAHEVPFNLLDRDHRPSTTTTDPESVAPSSSTSG